MARPLKTGLEYFPHDVDMSEDLKIRKLEARFGLTGYALYNKILEQQYKYAGKFTLKCEDNLKLYCKEWKITKVKLFKIIEACISLELFEDEKLLSDSIRERLEKINNHRKSQREHFSKKKSENKKINYLEIVSESENVAETPQSKVKESKEKKSSVCKHTHDFESFHKTLLKDDDYSELKKFDLKYYFDRVINFYPDKQFTDRELKAKIIFFIGNDKKSVKHEAVKNPLAKKDSVTVAYELVKNNFSWIKELPDKNPDEVIPELIKKCRDPARNDALFEAYVEKALRYYLSAINN